MNIFNLSKTEEEAVLFLQNTSILPKEHVCPNVHVTNLYFGNAVKSCMKRVNIRTVTWFCGTRLPFVKSVRFFYSWAFELTSMNSCGVILLTIMIHLNLSLKSLRFIVHPRFSIEIN